MMVHRIKSKSIDAPIQDNVLIQPWFRINLQNLLKKSMTDLILETIFKLPINNDCMIFLPSPSMFSAEYIHDIASTFMT